MAHGPDDSYKPAQTLFIPEGEAVIIDGKSFRFGIDPRLTRGSPPLRLLRERNIFLVADAGIPIALRRDRDTSKQTILTEHITRLRWRLQAASPLMARLGTDDLYKITASHEGQPDDNRSTKVNVQSKEGFSIERVRNQSKLLKQLQRKQRG